MTSPVSFLLPWCVLSLAGMAHAADSVAESVKRGADIYVRPGMCSTCHQADGAGLAGAFPALAGSEWVTGSSATLIRIVEHGFEGEVTVNDKLFSGVMPAQSGQLSTAEIADVLTYVRRSWGNDAGAITVKNVESQRRIDHDRGEKPWTANELKTSAQPQGLDSGQVAIYAGPWQRIPDAAKLPAPRRSLAALAEKELMPDEGGLLVATGTLTSIKVGDALVSLRAAGPAQVWIDEHLVLSTPSVVSGGDLPRVERVISLPLGIGLHRFRLVFLGVEKRADMGIACIRLPGYARPISLTADEAVGSESGDQQLELSPQKAGETLIYRGVFPMPQTSSRSIMVGFPKRVSMCFDAINNTWSMAWLGDFISPRHHWSGRGMGDREWPLAEHLALLPGEPPLAVLASFDAAWPGRCDVDVWPAGYRFLGYDLDRAKRPTFTYQIAGATVTDRPEPLLKNDGLRRTLEITATQPLNGLTFRPLAGKHIQQVSPTSFRLAGRLLVTLGLPAGSVATLRNGKDGEVEILVPLTLIDHRARLTQDYQWENLP